MKDNMMDQTTETNSALTTFSFDDIPFRVVEKDGQLWFPLAETCRALEITNSGNAAARLDDDEKGVHSMDTLGGEQGVTIINESGLYNLIFGSRKKTAKRFKKWVTSEVLPQIRKTGQYTPDAKPTKKQTIGAMRPDNEKLFENYRIVLPKDTYHGLQDTITRLQAELIQSEREHLQTQRALLQSQQELLQLKLEYAAN